MNKKTGEIEEEAGVLNQVKIIWTKRPNNTLRIQHNFDNCPTMTEQHSIHVTDINYLMKKYNPDELAQYISARNQNRREIIGHDFSIEPTLQVAKNTMADLKRAFNTLPENLKTQFKSASEFLKFIDNPANAEKMIKLGILSKKQINQITDALNNKPNDDKTSTTTTTITTKEVPLKS